MMNLLVLAVSFVSLYITLVWLNLLYFSEQKLPKKTKRLPLVSIAVPAHNEEESIAETIQSVLNLHYPKDKIEIILVDDASTDNTLKVMKEFLADNKERRIILIERGESTGSKAPVLNQALEVASGELFACLDADSVVEKDSLIKMIPYFSDEKTAAVISGIKVKEPKTIYEKIQRLEYLMALLLRRLMAYIETLSMTPGVLSIYRTKLLRQLGGFDDGNLTEDFEIAMRLKYYGYNVQVAHEAQTFTKVPSTLNSFWRQRIRWFRGFIYNNLKYKQMFLNKNYGLFGYFQMPLNVVAVLLLMASVAIVTYGTVKAAYEFVVRSINIPGYFYNTLFSIPTPKELLLSQNLKIMLPIFVSSLLGLYMLYVAHKQVKEKVKQPFAIWSYFVIYPYLMTAQWLSALYHELAKLKRKW